MKDAIRITLLPLLAGVLIGCSANGGLPGGGGGGGNGNGNGDNGGDTLQPGDPVPEDFVCTSRLSGPVSTTVAGGGCELGALLGMPTCEILDPDNAGDADPDSFAAFIVNGTGLDPLTELGGEQTNVSLTVDTGGVFPGEGTVAAFDIEIPGGMDIDLLETILIETLVDGEPTGESVDVGAMADLGGTLATGRFLAGFVPEMAYNQIRLTFGAALTLDLDEQLFVYDACGAAEAPPEEEPMEEAR